MDRGSQLDEEDEEDDEEDDGEDDEEEEEEAEERRGEEEEEEDQATDIKSKQPSPGRWGKKCSLKKMVSKMEDQK